MSLETKRALARPATCSSAPVSTVHPHPDYLLNRPLAQLAEASTVVTLVQEDARASQSPNDADGLFDESFFKDGVFFKATRPIFGESKEVLRDDILPAKEGAPTETS